MIVYLLVIALISCCVFSFDINERKNNRSFWEKVVVLVLILMAGLRNHVGSDSFNYEDTFYHSILPLKDYFSDVSWEDLREPIWLLLMSTCKSICGSFVFFQIVHAVILNVLLYRFYKKVTNKVFTVFLITFLVSWIGLNFEILRQSLCMAIFLNAVLLLRERKILAYVILSILMFGIHSFSIVIAIITPLALFIKKKYIYPILLIAAFFVFFFVDETLLNLLFLQTEGVANDDMQVRMNSYLTWGNYGYENININGIIRLLTLNVFFPLSIVLLNKEDKANKPNEFRSDKFMSLKVMQNSFVLLYMVIGLLASKLLIFFRFQQYFLPFIIISSVGIFYSKKRKGLLTVIFYLLFTIFVTDAVINLYKPSPGVNSPVPYDTRYFPYTSVFQEEDQLRKRMWGL